ncbi:hypothetical protein D9758_014416 [Tetrapyrgos nigripes]|uniref:Amidase domain-containing protein n=1 Tax=Tetrapyrgos nigripes TaxID=182062 RepID=A0A8H5FQ75_9AGAR|nr:hypothetical protein D9758_014416 [Tetrapyrgos nigripes]
MVRIAFTVAAFGLTCAYARISSVSRTVIINDSPYYLPTEPLVTLGQDTHNITGDALPFTILADVGDGSGVKSSVENWETIDDVFNKEFLNTVVLAGSSLDASGDLMSFLNESGTQMMLTTTDMSSVFSASTFSQLTDADLPAGPYILAHDATGSLAVYAPLRLHYDHSQFLQVYGHEIRWIYEVVSASLDTDSSPYIAVPSRVHTLSKNDSELPLAGLRVSVKDLYYMKGLVTSAGNRAFYSTYPARNSTGPAITRLTDLGAHMVGTTKMVQFANGDRATADWVDYHAPFSPRGDGYLEPSGSSTGAGTSIATLDWLDVSLGSDTGGSVRSPAALNGVYGIRPSVGAISLDEVLPLSPILDTAGYLTRSPKLFSSFGKAWYGESFQSYPAFPKKLLVSDDFLSVTDAANAVYRPWIEKLRSFLGGETAGNYSIEGHWNASSGIQAELGVYLNETYATLVAYYQWTNVGKPLFEDYAAQNGGRSPHINPQVRYRWRYGESKGADGYAAELEKRETFENWTLSNFLTDNAESCTESIFLYPINSGTYSSRETYYSSPFIIPFGFSSNRVANLARSAEVVIPIGQIPFHSNITEVEEHLPVSISLVARRGCDFVLLDLVDKLADEGLVQEVKTGRTAF